MMSTSLEIKRHRVEDYNDALNKVCGGFRVEPASHCNGMIKGEVCVQSVLGLDIAHVSQNSQYIKRTKKEIDASPSDYFFLVIQKKGRAMMVHNDVQTLMSTGDMLLIDSEKPCHFEYNQAFSSQMSLHLPRDEMQYRFGAKNLSTQQALSNDSALCQSIQFLLREIQNQTDSYKLELVEAFYSLLGVYLNTNNEVSIPLDRKQNIANEALKIISRHFSNPDLTPELVAEKMGISLRQLQKSFKFIDETPHRKIQQTRIKAAAYLINQQSKPSISSIAYECGFNDLSTFYRIFRKNFGRSPKSLKSEDKE